MQDRLSAAEYFWEAYCESTGREDIEGTCVVELNPDLPTPFPDLRGKGAVLVSMDHNSELVMEVYEHIEDALAAMRERYEARVLH